MASSVHLCVCLTDLFECLFSLLHVVFSRIVILFSYAPRKQRKQEQWTKTKCAGFSAAEAEDDCSAASRIVASLSKALDDTVNSVTAGNQDKVSNELKCLSIQSRDASKCRLGCVYHPDCLRHYNQCPRLATIICNIWIASSRSTTRLVNANILAVVINILSMSGASCVLVFTASIIVGISGTILEMFKIVCRAAFA